MAKQIFSLLLLFSLLLGLGIVELEASHSIYTSIHLASQNQTKTPWDSTFQPYRTGYHFQPPSNWINDPNGPMIYKGIYHLFYQYNPKGAVWGNIVWAHSTSTDLINWIPHPPAIFPSQKADVNGCWSGSATILPGEKPVMLYTGIDPDKNQVQSIAYPKDLSDPYLKEWVKPPQNPLMAPTEQNNINASSFRDPTTAWLGPDNVWRVLIGSRVNDLGLAILYKSKDFFEWIKAPRPLHSARHTGMWECPDFFPVSTKGTNGLETSTLGPDVKHVLKISLDETKHDYYTIGYYNYTTDKYTPDKGFADSDAGLKFDYGKFYASKTFFDSAKDRRILWGWINESQSVADDVKKGWAGIQVMFKYPEKVHMRTFAQMPLVGMAIPRNVWLDKSGKQLLQWPVAELEQLRENSVTVANRPLAPGDLFEISGITANQADVEISFDITDFQKAEVFNPKWTHAQWLCSTKNASVRGAFGPFGLRVLASSDQKEYTSVFFRIFKRKADNKPVVLMCSDQSSSSLNTDNDMTAYGAFLNVDLPSEKLSLRSLIDHSVVESFGVQGKACISARVYPILAIQDKARLYAFNNGTEVVNIEGLNAWSMKKAQIA